MRPYPEQVNAAATAPVSGQGIVSMPTGTGKSLTMALLIDQLQVRTLVIVPTLGLKEQLTATFEELFGRTDDLVVENIGSSRLPGLKNFDCLIIDEAHHAAANTYRRLNKTAWAGIYYRFCFTATPFRSRTEEQILMESITGQVIYELTYKTAVEKGYIVPLDAYYVDLPEIEVKASARFDKVYAELVVNRRDKNEATAKLVQMLHAQGAPTLVLTRQVEHGRMVQDACGALGVMAPFVNGMDKDSKASIRDFNRLLEPALIGTTGVIGEGVDTKPCEFAIIATTMKSRNLFMQAVGRTFRKFMRPDGTWKKRGTVILFRDPSHAWTLSHFEECVKTLKEEYGVEIQRLEL